MNNLLTTTCAAAFLAATFGTIGAATAPVARQCEAELAAVDQAIADATFTNANAQQNLFAKQDAAVEKVEQGKIDDAIQKLDDIARTASTLASAPKPKLNDASGIVAATDAAAVCLIGG